MSTVYVLMEEGWEYNDETFFHPESGSGTPVKIFNSLEAAEKECQKRNLDSFKGLFESGEASQYFYNFEDILPYPERKDKQFRKKLNALLEKVFGSDIEDFNEKFDNRGSVQTSPDATDEDWLAIYNMVNLSFWNVVECEKED